MLYPTLEVTQYVGCLKELSLSRKQIRRNVVSSKEMKDVKEVQSGVLLGKYSCPECLSNDNLLVYVKHNETGDE